MISTSKIVKVEEGVGFWTFTPFKRTYLLDRMHPTVSTELTDSRRISPRQRKHIYAIINDVADYTGYDTEDAKSTMKYLFYEKTGFDEFSLSNCDMTTANRFIEFLIDFCLSEHVPTKESLKDHAPDVSRYVYSCLVHKRCCITGMPADLHHVDAVGQGRDRAHIIHEGMKVLPLCRAYHKEAHTIGDRSFCRKYKLVPIELDAYLCKQLGLKSMVD